MITIFQPANCTESPPRLLFSVHRVSFLISYDPLTNMAVKMSIKKMSVVRTPSNSKGIDVQSFSISTTFIICRRKSKREKKDQNLLLIKKKRRKKQAQGKQSLWTLFCPGLFLVDATVACGLSCLLRFGSWDRFLFLYQSDYTCRYQTQVGNRRKESIVFR